jgi:predicted house-cleaning noncanonical NTP pyrophosphatase (MazG superfamily)
VKLVRGKVPGLFPQHNYRRAEQAEMLLLLRLKLAEEVGEVLSAPTQLELAQELADVMDVVGSLAALSGIGSAQLANLREIKQAVRGDFMDGWVLE